VANYYAADLSHWSMFDNFGVPSKTFYAFLAFRGLLETPRRVACTGWNEDGPITACAGLSADAQNAGVLVSNFSGTEIAQTIALAGLPWSGERYWGSPPAGSITNSPFAVEASNRSEACLRYSKLAQPAQAKMARMNRTAVRTSVLRFTGN